jgi:hypothetical protein
MIVAATRHSETFEAYATQRCPLPEPACKGGLGPISLLCDQDEVLEAQCGVHTGYGFDHLSF